MNNEYRILYKKVGKEPFVTTVKDTLEAKQKLVGGLIEIVALDENTLIVCNEEGKILNLPPNLIFDYDYITGDCFLIGDDYKNNGEYRSLTDDEIIRYTAELNRRSFKYIEKDCSSKRLDKNER